MYTCLYSVYVGEKEPQNLFFFFFFFFFFFSVIPWIPRVLGYADHVSHSLNSLKGIIQGSSIGVIKGDTRGLDCGSYVGLLGLGLGVGV